MKDILGPTMKNLYGLKKYGLSKDKYFEMIIKCDNKCMICGKPPKQKALHIDHSHKTGKVRGLLCFFCNSRLIGKTGDKENAVEMFIKAAEYIKQSLN